jgi:anti-sigma regulatory factor (Ser/Thr protein kinase)
MLGTVDTSRGEGSLTHRALLYGSKDEFLASTVPFIQDGLDRGAPIRVAVTDRKRAWLRAALGSDARYVIFSDGSQCYRHPVQTLAATYRTVRAANSGGPSLRMIGEPLWTPRTAQECKEWERYESLVNVALAWANATLVCTYDTRIIDPNVVTEVARTHPELVVSGGTRPSPSYADPVTFSVDCDRPPLPALPPPTLWLRFGRAEQLVTLRDFVTSHANLAGADTQRIEQFVLAVNEVATNVVQHGGGEGVLQIWTDPRRVLCEVSDTGSGVREPLAGQLPPNRFAIRGRGLWLARQSCDLVEMRTGPAGTVVRLHLTRD